MKLTMRVLIIFLVGMILVCSSCGEKEDEPNHNASDTNTPVQTLPDPEGTITLTVPVEKRVELQGKDGIRYSVYYDGNYVSGNMVDLGKFDCLSAVDGNFPIKLKDWGYKAFAHLNHGYVSFAQAPIGGAYGFARIFITKILKGEDGLPTGIEIKCESDWQQPFNVPFEVAEEVFNLSSDEFDLFLKSDYPVIIQSVNYDETSGFIRYLSFSEFGSIKIALRSSYLSTNNNLVFMPDGWKTTIDVITPVNTKKVTIELINQNNVFHRYEFKVY